ncbi:hypothetical protein QQX98_012389 [Neonectria punicea]|uniref:Uncharacterized protein n=2 Tax=Neonectria TaxID=140106 RepID=A0ABR1GJF5_9HYPO
MINGAGKPSGPPSGESRPSGPDLDSDEANTFLSDEDEHGDDILCRNGKRKRPVSVSHLQTAVYSLPSTL